METRKKLKIMIDLEGYDIMTERTAVKRILNQAADKLNGLEIQKKNLMDINGNTIGYVEVIEEEL